MFYELVKVLI